MKVLIVDDEKHVRDCLNLLADWDAYGITQVFEAESTAQAIMCMEKEQPELVLTDIQMPQQDGTALMTWLHDHAPQTQVVVISAFREFEYALSAMRCGALDYLLKPIQPKQLNEVLKKASDIFCVRQHFQENSVFSLDTNERILLALLAEGDTALASHSRLQQIFSSPVGLMVVDLFCAPALIDPAVHPKYIQKVLGEHMAHNKCGWVVRGVSKPDLLYILLPGNESVQAETTSKIITLLKRICNGPIHSAVIYNGVWDSRMLSARVEELALCMENEGLSQCYGGTTFSLPTDPESFFSAASKGNIERVSIIAAQWMQMLNTVNLLTRRELKKWWTSLCGSCEQFLGQHSEQSGTRPAFLIQQQLLPVLSEQGRFLPPNFHEWIVQQAVNFSENFGIILPDHIDLAAKIEEEIRLHYTEQISLSCLASKYYHSASHIARIFKDRYQISVGSYIICVRVEQAKRLLKTTDLRVAQIAHMVGYGDEKYFCRVFKRATGISPACYRNL